MFTGIVTGLGTVRALTPIGAGADMRLTIATPDGWGDVAKIPQGASIACNGCCLTAVALGPDWFAVEASAETLSKTTLGDWKIGTRVNLERPLKVGDELGGHIVAGHVDGVARVLSVTLENGSSRWLFEVPPELSRFIAQKGSVAVDGVSLTVNEVARQTFGVNIIPHTNAHTRFATTRPGDDVNLEIDTVARYVARLTEHT